MEPCLYENEYQVALRDQRLARVYGSNNVNRAFHLPIVVFKKKESCTRLVVGTHTLLGSVTHALKSSSTEL